MPKPKTKQELLDLSQQNFQKLYQLIDSFSETEVEKEFHEGTMNRNIRDILAHLHQWHLMLLDWYEVGMSGEKPDMPAKGYIWKMMPELNRKIWKDCQNIPLKAAKSSLKDSFQTVQKIIKAHSNEALFEKKRFKWTGSTSLGVYLISNTSSHYDWAIKQIKKGMK